MYSYAHTVAEYASKRVIFGKNVFSLELFRNTLILSVVIVFNISIDDSNQAAWRKTMQIGFH